MLLVMLGTAIVTGGVLAALYFADIIS